MSLAIDVDKIKGVLLSDGWHEVSKKSFTMDAYEFLWFQKGKDFGGKEIEPRILHGGGSCGVCAAGFCFSSEKKLIFGPLTSILAVRY